MIQLYGQLFIKYQILLALPSDKKTMGYKKIYYRIHQKIEIFSIYKN